MLLNVVPHQPRVRRYPGILEEDSAGLVVGIQIDKLPLRINFIRVATAVGANRMRGNARIATGILTIRQLTGANRIVRSTLSRS